MSNEGGVLNRVGFTLINWAHVEQISVNTNTACIYYISGRVERIGHLDKVEKLKDFIKVFPDITDDATRNTMKQKLKGIKTDINERSHQSMRGEVRVDVPKPEPPPAPPKKR